MKNTKTILAVTVLFSLSTVTFASMEFKSNTNKQITNLVDNRDDNKRSIGYKKCGTETRQPHEWSDQS